MARARNIKPGFFCNDRLVELPFATRLLFIGLWTVADKAGRLEDRPKKIKMAVFPADDIDCDGALQELAEAGFIVRYQAGGIKCVQILNWDRHQNPHVKEADSVIPPIPESAPEKPVQAPEIPILASPKPERAGLIPDSLLLIPDSPNPHPARVLRAAVLSRFPEFWREYPRREAKPKAEAAWEKHVKTLETVDAILANVRVRRASEAWTKDGGQFIPLPATYLNQRRWEDEAQIHPEDEPDEVVAARVMAKIQAEDRERAGRTQ